LVIRAYAQLFDLKRNIGGARRDRTADLVTASHMLLYTNSITYLIVNREMDEISL
jgi:hypothetical protein